MATNIEMNYFNGSSYVALRPMGNFSNIDGSLTSSQIPNLDAGKITSGILNVNRIPNLNASKITTGTFSVNQIPNLDASKIASGILPVIRGGTGYSDLNSLKSALGIDSGMQISKGAILSANNNEIIVNWSNFIGKVAIMYTNYTYSTNNYGRIVISISPYTNGTYWKSWSKISTTTGGSTASGLTQSFYVDCLWSDYSLTIDTPDFFINKSNGSLISGDVYYIIIG